MPAYYDNVTALNPKVWFKLNETTGTPANSGSLSAVTLTKNGSGTIDLNQTGVIDKAIKFNNTLASAPNYTYYDVANSSSNTCMDDRVFSIEFWIKWNDTGGSQNQGIIYDLRDGNNYLTVQYSPFGIGPIVSFRGGTSYPNYDLYGSVANNNSIYRHVVLTFTPTAVKLYNDGSLISTVNNPNIPNSFVWDTISAKKFGVQGGMLIDEFIIYDQELTAAQVLSNYNAPYSTVNNATVVTASALLPMPAISAVRNPNYTASVVTASSLFVEPSWNFTNYPTMLDTYLAARSFEQWYKFDEIGKITNYGSGGNAETAWAFNGVNINEPQTGIQGSGALKIKAEVDNSVKLAFGVNEPYSTEITDNEFSLGVWFKGESGFGAKNTKLVDFNNPFSTDFYHLTIDSNGYAIFSARGTQTHNVTVSTNLLDGNWHLIQVRASDTDNAIKMSIDNGTEASTTVNGNVWPQGIGDMQLGRTTDTGTNNKYGYISNMWITGYSSIGSTERAAMITAAAVPIQGTAKIVPATARFTNQYQEKIDTYSPKIAFRLNEASGTPVNYGSGGTLSVGKNGTNITYLQPTQNTYAYKFTNADTFIQGDYAYSSGTFSTGNHQTMAAVFKAESTVNFEQLIGSMGMYGFLGSGITLSIGATNGYLEARINQGFGGTDTDSLTTTTNVCDNKYHHAVGVRDGSSFKLYLDGKQVATMSTAGTTLSDAATYAISGEGKFNFGQGAAAKALHIDEFAVMSTSLSAAQVFELYQLLNIDGAMTGSGLMVQPTNIAGTGRTINPGVSTATALLVDPSQLDTIAPTIAPMTLDAMFQMPNFAATKNTNNASAPMTASATGENPVVSAGGIVGALHMNAIASFPEAKARIPGVWNADPITISAQMVQPGLATTLGALVKAQSLNAKAFLPLPPAYYLVSDDKWYQRLLDVDYQSSNYGGIITFFNTSNSIYLNGGYGGWSAYSNRNPLNANYGYNLYDTPLPVASAGYVDPLNRKALNLRNIALEQGDNETYSGGWTMEAMIQTTKKNQFIAAGRYRGDTSSSVSRSYRTGIRLKDGKIAFTEVKDSTLGFFKSNDPIAFSGFKNIADGEWHHIIIQYRPDGTDQYAPRVQVFIDGELDVQRYGQRVYFPGQIGYNSNDANVYSDFNISAISTNKGSFVLERETHLNYYAAFGITPFEATPATASVELTTGNRGKGNRARALMLYFWPTFNAESGYYVGDYYNPFKPVGVNTSSGHDVGNEPFDYDTFYGLSTYLTDKTQTFFDWDVFPLPVMNFYSGDTYRGDSNPLLNKDVTIASGTTRGTTYVDPVTNNYRYVNLMKDVYELDQYDAIFFRNYPDQSKEQDATGLNSKTEVDEYFNLQEKTLFAEFLDNLREAIDTYNISLFVTNPQLAKDLGIISNVSDVPLLRDQGSFFADEYSDNRAPVVTGRVLVDGTPKDVVNEFGAGWIDTWFNDRHRVINTLEYLTDDNTFIWTDYAMYQNSDEIEYGGPDRLYKRYENRPYGLQIDDEFVFADSGNPKNRLPYQAVKPSDILAGIPITALSKKIWNQNYVSYVQVDNPYKDYVTTIALPPGTNLKGKITTSKIFVSFSENVSNSHTYVNPQFGTEFVEYHTYDMASNYWVDIAFNAGIIDSATRAQYKAGTSDQPPLYDDNDSIKQYWSLSGDNIVSRVVPVTQNLKGFVGGDVAQLLAPAPSRSRTRNSLAGLLNSTRLRDALGRFASGGGSSAVTGGNLKTFKIQTGRVYDTGTVFTPSINTRGLWWLSDKVRLTGKVVGGPAMNGTAEFPNPIVTADRPNTIIVQSMIATATINETQFRGADRRISVLPMYGSATIIGLGGKNVRAGTPATANATINGALAITQGPDQVVMYLHHVDPILYLRKEIIR